jgi:acetyltransferase-like isoleucine patch superfamily enzyme
MQRGFAGVYRFLRAQERNARYREAAARGLLQVGRHTYGVPEIDLYASSESRIDIGSFCSLSRGVTLVAGGSHPPDRVSTIPFRIRWQLEGAYRDGMPATRGDVVIGPDVWIGTDAMILSGVTIGPGAIIAARSVVTRDIPPYAIAAGVPARVLRQRFCPESIARLLALAWWDWSDAQIREAIPLLSSPCIEAFLDRYDSGEPDPDRMGPEQDCADRPCQTVVGGEPGRERTGPAQERP